jgi:rhombotail lipoprotein
MNHSGNSSSLVEFLYPDGTPPRTDTVPELRIPLHVGLAILPPKQNGAVAALDAQQRVDLLEKIKARFSSRQFVSDITVIPDYYLATARGFAGLAGIQRLQNLDLIALVSYDQVIRQSDNTLSLGYLTIVGAYILPGTSRDTTTLVDLAVVDPASRSLVLRAGGTSTGHGASTLAEAGRTARKASVAGFDAATAQLINNFDAALTGFEQDVRAGKANVRVVRRSGSAGGGGALGALDAAVLLVLLAVALSRKGWVRSEVSGSSLRICTSHDAGAALIGPVRAGPVDQHHGPVAESDQEIHMRQQPEPPGEHT